MKSETIILASSSPRRIDMMRQNGIDPIIIRPKCEEDLPDKINMQDAVMYLSLKKALEVENILKHGDYENPETSAKLLEKKPYIIAADTIVYKDHIIGKPIDKDDAYDLLCELSGKMHYVATGVSIIQAGTTKRRTFCEVTQVYFKKYTGDELLPYLDTDEPYDKAGAYAVQGTFSKYIERIEGDTNNVIGFPWDRYVKEFSFLKELHE